MSGKFEIDKQWKYQRTNPKLIIAFSLYGDIPMYTEGAVQNVLLANKIYQNWTSFKVPTKRFRRICSGPGRFSS